MPLTLNALRSVSLFALASCTLSAHALDAYSSLDPAPNSYRNNAAYNIGSGIWQAFQFVATETGVLSGFQLAMNNDRSGPTGYTLRLYSDSGSNTLGSVLGTYSGTSTGIDFDVTRSALSTVAATGPAVAIQSGATYWLYADSSSPLVLNFANSGSQRSVYSLLGGQSVYVENSGRAAFSIQVDPITSAVPGPCAALAFGVGLIRRRKKA